MCDFQIELLHMPIHLKITPMEDLWLILHRGCMGFKWSSPKTYQYLIAARQKLLTLKGTIRCEIPLKLNKYICYESTKAYQERNPHIYP